MTVVDNTVPFYVTRPANIQYTEGSTGNSVVWNTTDNHPGTYTVYRNGTEIGNGNWNNSGTITLNVDGLSEGEYIFQILVRDEDGNQAGDSVRVTVVDQTSPIYVTIPSDLQYDEGATGNTLTWNSTDLHSSTYTIYRNDTQVDSGTWTNATDITINVDGLTKGTYNYTILITDISGNSAVDTAYLTVLDNIDPIYVSIPSDLQYNEGSTSNTLTWNSTDGGPDTYIIYRNGSQVDSGSWTNAANIVINVDGYAKATYNYTIVITDTTGNQAIDIAYVIVVDGTNPIYVSNPSDIQYNEGNTGNTLTWNSTDTYPDTYVIYRDGSQVDTGSWSNAADITINVDGLTEGIYNYTIVSNDTSGNIAIDTAFVTVYDVTDPIFTIPPSDMQYDEGTTSNILNWTATDAYSDTYIIYQNGSQVDTNSWTSDVKISYNVDGLSKAVYNFTIVVIDSSGNSATNTVFVTVVDQTLPTLSSPTDVQYIEGTTNNKITWNAVDTYPDGMNIYRNGTSIFSTSWTSGDIEILVDGLSAGVYNYTIVVADKSSNQASDTVFVTVIDNILPSLNTPSDIIYAEESTGNAIDWTGIDLHADNYIIYENGSEVDTGSWASGAPISFDIDGLLKGAYNFTIIIFDTSNNSANDTVIVTVNDETSPSVNNPANILYAFGLTGNLINWTATDNYNNSYIIYQNGSLVDNGNWDSGVTISYNVDGFGNG
ncbi:MAG: beta strand repeat-containing protein, partial [Candidatus Kariarchaeaceae archaeon]